jgi:hypothetical protein
MEIKLLVNGKEANFGINFARNILSSIPENEIYADLIHEFAKSKCASIRSEVARRNYNSPETIELLLQDKNIEVLLEIITNDSAREYITDEHLDEIVISNNEDAIENIIRSIDNFENTNKVDLFEKIMQLENDYLLLQIADGYHTPKVILKQLVKHHDPDIASAAQENLK